MCAEASRWIITGIIAALLQLGATLAAADSTPIHGLWVWKGPSVIAGAHSVDALVKFCHSQNINEVYISVSDHGDLSALGQFVPTIEALHGANVRIQALISSTDADEPGKHRDKLVDQARAVVQFNRAHPATKFDGIHLDIEPQQRPENKGPGNLRFLPGLVDAYRAVRAVAEPAQMAVNVDVQNKLLKGTLAERRLLLSSVTQMTLMLYELSNPDDSDTTEQKLMKLQQSSKQYLDMAYDGLQDRNLARMAIGLRTPDYGELLPQMLQSLDQNNRSDPRYLGWARHAYNDVAK
jgi:hypothetical protein